MADGCHFEKKPLNHHISATVRPILMKFSTLTDAYWPLAPDQLIKFSILKIQDSGSRHLEKSQKSRYLRNGLTDLYEIWFAS